jgi:hypothetical protein
MNASTALRSLEKRSEQELEARGKGLVSASEHEVLDTHVREGIKLMPPGSCAATEFLGMCYAVTVPRVEYECLKLVPTYLLAEHTRKNTLPFAYSNFDFSSSSFNPLCSTHRMTSSFPTTTSSTPTSSHHPSNTLLPPSTPSFDPSPIPLPLLFPAHTSKNLTV